MSRSTNQLNAVLETLSEAARNNRLNDTEWATSAGLPKETLSRLRRRKNCEFTTLAALADAVDRNIAAVPAMPELTSDGHFPSSHSREFEQHLLSLCASRSLSPDDWIALGPNFFMAGLAVMISCVDGFDRSGLLSLAEYLNPGASEPAVFSRWLDRSPVRPDQFLPMLDTVVKYAS